MEIKKIDERDLVVSQRKKRNQDKKKTIFEIYKSEKTVKDYMFHLKDFLHFVYEGENDFSISEVADYIGYFDTSYFIRIFKTLVKVTPLKYRESLSKARK